MTDRKPISLKKAEENVRISLKKKDIIDAPTCAVGLALDVSGSMSGMYSDGSVSDIVTRILALAKTFDDNGEMDMWVFDTNSHKIENATEDNYESFVKDCIIRRGYVGGGTAYSPCLNAVNDFYFPNLTAAKATAKVSVETTPKKGFFGKMFGKTETVVTHDIEAHDIVASEPVMPAFVVFLTDGENAGHDLASANALFAKSSKNPIYWLLVGVGSDVSHFNYLKDTAAKYDNVGYLQFDNLDMSDETLYDGIISQEFVDCVSNKH